MKTVVSVSGLVMVLLLGVVLQQDAGVGANLAA